jgi:hypothetical protein
VTPDPSQRESPGSSATRDPSHRAKLSSARVRRAWWPFGLALATAAVALTAMSGLWWLPGRPAMDIATAEVPASARTTYLAHDRGGHLDHHVLYHGLDRRANRRLAEADVLFLGNSRLMFGLDPRALRTTFVPMGLSYYVLGFGHDEGHAFPLALIDRYDLRPKVVVVNLDNFFTIVASAWAERVLEDGWFDAIKLRFEGATAHLVRRHLHRVVPHWPDVIAAKREFVIHRSAVDGTWSVGTRFPRSGPLPLAPEPDQIQMPPNVVARAQAFKADLERRGSRLVFCLVPSPDSPRARAFALGAAVGVPVVAPVPEDPQTIDGSHLTEESAERFSNLLLSELAPIVQREALASALSSEAQPTHCPDGP